MIRRMETDVRSLDDEKDEDEDEDKDKYGNE